MPEGDRPRRRRRRLLRHRIHMYAYASVSFALMMMGLVFSGFAIFERESEISKIWLAGPTTIAVGLVLCGKVIIDCRPRESSDEDDYDEEIADVAPPTPQREKGIVMTSESKHLQNVAKDNSLIIENFALGNKELVHQREPLTLRSDQSDLESEVWNLRDDCSSVVSSYEHHHHHQHHYHPHHNQTLCLHNPSARDSTMDIVDGAHYYRHLNSYNNSADHDQAAGRSCHSQTMQSSGACSPLSQDHRVFSTIAASTTPPSRHSHCVDDDEHLEMSNSLYQGETFLLNDKQYFI